MQVRWCPERHGRGWGWGVRESYISLIADLMSDTVSNAVSREVRNVLRQAARDAYADAPRTSSRAFARAHGELQNSDLAQSGATGPYPSRRGPGAP
ncbi:hypothetical protein ACFTXB_15240 [Streptomyces sp. NPDC057074]|uniref:hypothetical protein n=1 Tax=Streptomyces sp. NPDC057074 TaxID=3346015 RepID=UPI0036271A68